MAIAEELWDAHRSRKDQYARESIILHYAPLVKYVADRFPVVLSGVLDMEDVISAGTLGLIRAVEHFDPGKGVPFASYAITCIRGAILDQLRALDAVPRSVRQKAREIEKAIGGIQAELGRLPTDDEVASQMGLDLSTYQRRLTEVAVSTVSLDYLAGGDDDDESPGLLSILEDENSPDPVSLAEKNGLLNALTGAIAQLTERERLLLSLYYKEELTMREVSAVMGISESRVCQLHTRAVLRLRAQLHLWRNNGLATGSGAEDPARRN
jgi:RNA polymerase sigma factor for flagellar operon FliA